MSPRHCTAGLDDRIEQRAAELRAAHQRAIWKQTDRLFALLLILQWLAGIVLAAWLSPWAWEGLDSHIHPHIWASIFLGGLIAALPVSLALVRPAETSTRFIIASAQMMHSALLIHLSGGRIETHFHIFGSLAFLSFYRDWRVLVPATLVVAIDHAARGIFWPESVFGVAGASPWRWIEHAGWVLFEDIFLTWSCIRGAKEIKTLALRQAELEFAHDRVAAEVARQTERLENVSQELVSTARRAGMAEIATGVLHDVGNVLNSVNVSVNVAMQKLRRSETSSLQQVGQMLRGQDDVGAFLTTDERGRLVPAFLIELADCLGKENAALVAELQNVAVGLDHIKGIVSAQQRHAKSGALRQSAVPAELFEQAIAMDIGTAGESGIELIRHFEPIPPVALDKHKVLQILINLLSNARKAVAGSARPDKKIALRTRLIEDGDVPRVVFQVSDNGVGIDPAHIARIFSHGFTTRSEGHGFGLHSAANAAHEMEGKLMVHSDGPGRGATFTLDVPILELAAAELMLERRNGVAA